MLLPNKSPHQNRACLDEGFTSSGRGFWRGDKIKAGFFFWLFLAGVVFAEAISFNPSDLGIGARPLGLGKAFIALADDASSIFTNPAGLSVHNNLQLLSMYSTLFDNETYLTLGVANTYSFGTLGLGYINVALPNIEIYEFIGGWPVVVGYTSYNSGVFLLTYAKELNDKLQLGANLRLYTQGFSGGGASYEALSGTGTDADLGVIYRPWQWFLAGFTAQNFLPTSFGGRFNWHHNTEAVSIPATLKVGTAVKVLGSQAIKQWNAAELNLMLDYDYVLAGGNKTHFGVEFCPLPLFALRVGADNGKFATGLAFNYQDFKFDYAYITLDGPVANVAHAFSFSYYPGEKAKTAEQKSQSLENRPVTIPYFTDVKEGFFAQEAIERLAALEIISGFADGTFKPNDEITRAELAMFMVRSLGVTLPVVKQRVFKDIPEDHWSAPYVQAAVARDLMKGYPDGTFRPNWPMTRAEVIMVLSRYDNFPFKTDARCSFRDLSSTHWAYPVVAAAEERGILKFLKSQSDFLPNKKVTRAEATEMLYCTQYIQNIVRKQFKIGG